MGLEEEERMATKTVIKTHMPQIHGITIINDQDKLLVQQEQEEEEQLVVPKMIRIYQKNNQDIPNVIATTNTTTTNLIVNEEDVLKKMSQKSQTARVVAYNNNNNHHINNNFKQIKNGNNNKNNKIDDADDDDELGYVVDSLELETGCTANNLSINTNLKLSNATKTIEYPHLLLKIGDHDDDIQTSETITITTINSTEARAKAKLLSTVGCESSERPKTAVSINAMLATPLTYQAKENNAIHDDDNDDENNDDENIHHGNNYVESNGECIFNNNNKNSNNNNSNDEKSKSKYRCSGQTLSSSPSPSSLSSESSMRDLNAQSSNRSQREEPQSLDIVNDNDVKKGDCISVALTDECKDSQDKIHVVKIQIPCSKESSKQHRQLEIVQHSSSVDQLISTDNNNIKQVTVVKLNEDNKNNLINNNSCEKNNIKHNISDINLDILHANSSLSLGIDSMVQKTQINGGNAVSVNGGNLVTSTGGTTVTELNVGNPNYLYYMMSSGQFSPCDTLDSGTCSDLESNAANSNPKKALSHGSNVPKMELHLKTTKIRVNNGNCKALEHQRASSLTDSEESEASSLSCDSLHSNEYNNNSRQQHHHQSNSHNGACNPKKFGTLLPDSLLRDIRGRKSVTSDDETAYDNLRDSPETVSQQDYVEVEAAHLVHERNNANNTNSMGKISPTSTSSTLTSMSTSSKINKRSSMPSKTFIINQENGTFEDTKMNSMPRRYEADKYYDFHVKEHENFHGFDLSLNDDINPLDEQHINENYFDTKSLSDESFAGYKDIRCRSAVSTIRSSKGTVRGVKNRVRNGIATFLQLQQPLVKSFKEKDIGKVVLYTTSMGIIRDTYAKCSNVKQILRTLLVKFEERDVFMSIEYQQEIKERMQSDIIKVPQLFVEGQHIGDADTVERLNESGELRQLLKPYKSIATTYTCQMCGGYRLLPCPSCNGSKKSVHRNHFTAEFVALKCMNCDEVGLVKCHNC